VRAIVLVFGLSLMAAPLYAQPHEPRQTVSAIAGFGSTYDDEGSLGRGALVGGAFERVLFGNLRLQLSGELLTHRRSEGFFQSSGQTITGGAALVQRFGHGSAQPYAFGGVTAGRHTGTNNFDGQRFPVSNSGAGLRFGGGVAFRAGRNFEIGPELRMNTFFINDDSDAAMLPSLGIRAGWRF
jgi:hypothetical protein